MECETELMIEDEGMFVSIEVGNVGVRILVDTGANVTIVPVRIFGQICRIHPYCLAPVTSRVRLADGRGLPVRGKVTLPLVIGGHTYHHPVWVAEVEGDGILGSDFLSAYSCQINLQKKRFSVNPGSQGKEACGASQPQVHSAVSKDCCRVLLDRDWDIEPISEVVLPGVLEGPGEGTVGCVEPDQEGPHPEVLVARTVVKLGQGHVPVRMVNLGDEKIVLRKGTMVGHCSPVNEIVEFDSESKAQAICQRVTRTNTGERPGIPKHLQGLWEESMEDLTGTQRDQLASVLSECSEAFAETDDDLGRTNLIQHTIEIGNARPIKQRPRRLPPKRQQELEEHVDKLLELGAVEPSVSPWASPIVAVTKKDGTTRFCVDYRELNKVTEKDAYPIPYAASALESLGGNTYFCTLDLLSGYHQVEVAEHDRPKTSFCTSSRTLQYTVLPFGLCNGTSTFGRLMEMVLTRLQPSICLSYLDDIIIFGADFETTLQRLQMVLIRLKQAGLKLKPRKC